MCMYIYIYIYIAMAQDPEKCFRNSSRPLAIAGNSFGIPTRIVCNTRRGRNANPRRHFKKEGPEPLQKYPIHRAHLKGGYRVVRYGVCWQRGLASMDFLLAHKLALKWRGQFQSLTSQRPAFFLRFFFETGQGFFLGGAH